MKGWKSELTWELGQHGISILSKEREGKTHLWLIRGKNGQDRNLRIDPKNMKWEDIHEVARYAVWLTGGDKIDHYT